MGWTIILSNFVRPMLHGSVEWPGKKSFLECPTDLNSVIGPYSCNELRKWTQTRLMWSYHILLTIWHSITDRTDYSDDHEYHPLCLNFTVLMNIKIQNSPDGVSHGCAHWFNRRSYKYLTFLHFNFMYLARKWHGTRWLAFFNRRRMYHQVTRLSHLFTQVCPLAVWFFWKFWFPIHLGRWCKFPDSAIRYPSPRPVSCRISSLLSVSIDIQSSLVPVTSSVTSSTPTTSPALIPSWIRKCMSLHFTTLACKTYSIHRIYHSTVLNRIYGDSYVCTRVSCTTY